MNLLRTYIETVKSHTFKVYITPVNLSPFAYKIGVYILCAIAI